MTQENIIILNCATAVQRLRFSLQRRGLRRSTHLLYACLKCKWVYKRGGGGGSLLPLRAFFSLSCFLQEFRVSSFDFPHPWLSPVAARNFVLFHSKVLYTIPGTGLERERLCHGRTGGQLQMRNIR